MAAWHGNSLLRLRHYDVIKWKHFSALLAICSANSPVTGEFPTQRPVTRSFDVFFDLCLNKRLSEAGDLRCPRGHYDVTVVSKENIEVLHYWLFCERIQRSAVDYHFKRSVIWNFGVFFEQTVEQTVELSVIWGDSYVASLQCKHVVT